MLPRPAVFLDRDGTINVEKVYLYRPDDFEFIPGVPAAIRRLNEAGLMVIVVTNQSGIARGYYTLDDVDLLHSYLNNELNKQSAHVDAFYCCPHHPTAGQGEFTRECDCRKGRPGMLLQAAEEYTIDLSRSFMIGDKPADIDAGYAAGCRPALVLTGYGQHAQETIPAEIPRCTDLTAAVDWVLSSLSE
jgi:D-glycero-D-manno-heptose 1,7-bisphosphate phosphatase